MRIAEGTRGDTGQIISRWLLKIVLLVAIVAVVAIEGGSVVINRLQAQDIADQAAAEAGITYAASGSLEQTQTAAEQFVSREGADFIDLRVDTAGGSVSVTVEKRAETRIVKRIGALRKFTVVRTTGTAPLRR